MLIHIVTRAFLEYNLLDKYIRKRKDFGGVCLKITIEDLSGGEEEQIIIRCDNLSEDMLRLIYKLKSKEYAIFGYVGEEIRRVNSKDVYYFESVDSKVFLYGNKDVMETKYKLYEIENELNGGDFLRVSKSVILNITKIKSLRPAFNGRFEADLNNGEKIIISRQYVADLKKKLGM